MLSVEKIETKLKGIDKKIEEYLLKIAESDRRDEVMDEIERDGIEPNITKYLDKIIELQNQV